MKVILFQDVKGIGKAGDIKDVSDGYARNFLLPKKLAEIANAASMQKADSLKKKQQEFERAELEKTQQIAETLQGREIVITAKEKDGKLFGSINAKAIAKELKKENLIISDKLIVLPDAIKETGDYDVKIELPHGIETSIHIVVESAQ